ncbi:Retrovirus-related Pol polyprotein from transposon [Abeliophyllum distichum]|uniref:Retrovirus-related Pol polyprotein from transposon n=1 Tax=Abeliophyllum distichum TaxID=126358 RepID=A0ABD1Q839_9LAMI
MVGINLSIACHALKVDPNVCPKIQKRRPLSTERYCALKEEVDKLLAINQRSDLSPVGIQPRAHKEKLTTRWKEVQSLIGRLATLNRFKSKATDRCQTFFQTIKGEKQFERTKECENAFQKLKILLRKASLLSKPKIGETLLIYFVVPEKAVSLLLILEEGPTQLPVYYVSKVLQDAETRYLWETDEVVIDLSQFNISYKPRPSINGQALENLWINSPTSQRDFLKPSLRKYQHRNYMLMDPQARLELKLGSC